MTEELKRQLCELADKYEVSSFCYEDPSQFLRWYSGERGTISDVEAASFLAAMLAFGSRKQFIPKISYILQLADGSASSFSKWLKSGAYKKDFPGGENKFYRFYSYDDMKTFFGELGAILNKSESLGEYFRCQWEAAGGETAQGSQGQLADIVSAAFPNSKIVPKGSNSANKRIHMFLRWMVRPNSAVDLGLWNWYNPSKLIIPLDVHVMQEAVRLGLLPPNASASRRTAERLTAELAQAFPGDPVRADFSLFGLGVDEQVVHD